MSARTDGRAAVVTPGLAIGRQRRDGGARLMRAATDEAGLTAALAGLAKSAETGRVHGDLRERPKLVPPMPATIDRFDRIDRPGNARRHRAVSQPGRQTDAA